MQQVTYFSERHDPSVAWVFRFLATAIGCSFRPSEDSRTAQVLYGNISGDPFQVQIPHWPAYYDKMAQHDMNGIGYWAPLQMHDYPMPIDVIGLIFRLLTLADEERMPEQARDPLGNLFTTAPGFRRAGFHAQAMVDDVTRWLKDALLQRGLLEEQALVSRWPHGKHFAVLITHDTDGPCLLELPELAKAGIKGIVRANRPEMRAFLAGCKRLLVHGDDPYFNFTQWATFEEEIGAKSAFYLYMKSRGVPGHIHNPVYRISTSRPKWHILHALAERGWEIGLHTSIHGLETDEYIQQEKHDLEMFLDQSVIGCRSHYWNINWRAPITSLRRLQHAGFAYDLSLAWKDAPGFRGGTALPYHPYDPVAQSGLTLLEIPTSLMDGHLFDYQLEVNPSELFAGILKQIIAHGSILNLDWHERTWVDQFSYRGWRSFLIKELATIVATGDAWFTTPRELWAHWLARERKILGLGS